MCMATLILPTSPVLSLFTHLLVFDIVAKSNCFVSVHEKDCYLCSSCVTSFMKFPLPYFILLMPFHSAVLSSVDTSSSKPPSSPNLYLVPPVRRSPYFSHNLRRPCIEIAFLLVSLSINCKLLKTKKSVRLYFNFQCLQISGSEK